MHKLRVCGSAFSRTQPPTSVGPIRRVTRGLRVDDWTHSCHYGVSAHTLIIPWIGRGKTPTVSWKFAIEGAVWE